MTRPHLFIVTASAQSWGAEKSLREMLEHGLAERFAVTVVLSLDSPFAAELGHIEGVSVHFHRFAEHPALSQGGSLASSGALQKAAELPSIVAGALRLLPVLRQADVVLNFSLWQLPETMLAALFLRKPLVVDVHETFEGAAGTRVLSALLRIPSLLIAPSRYVLHRARAANRQPIAVIPRPVKFNSPMTVGPKVGLLPKIGIFGQIAEHKGILEALRILEGVAADVLVVGGSKQDERTAYEEEVRAAVQRRGPGSAVLDRIPDPMRVMAECNYVLNASRHEAFGRGVIEGALSGSVPLVLPNSGPSECVERLGAGIVLQKIEDLRPLIASWDSQDTTRWESGRLRSPSVMAQFDPSRVAREYADAVASVLRKGVNDER